MADTISEIITSNEVIISIVEAASTSVYVDSSVDTIVNIDSNTSVLTNVGVQGSTTVVPEAEILVESTVDNTVLLEVAMGPAGPTYNHPVGDGNLHVPATGTINSGMVLTAGSTAGSLTWSVLPSGLPNQTGNTGKVLSTDGVNSYWAIMPSSLPSQTGNNGKVLSTDGTDPIWIDNLQGSGSVSTEIICTMRAHWTGSSIVVDSSDGFSSIVRDALGKYTLTFTNPMPSTEYYIDGNAQLYGYAGAQATGLVNLRYDVAQVPYNKTTTSVSIIVQNNESDAFFEVGVLYVKVTLKVGITSLSSNVTLGIPTILPSDTNLSLYYIETPTTINRVPIPLTANITSNGTCSGSSCYNTVNYFNGFNGIGSSGWLSTGGVANEFLKYAFNSPVVVSSYKLMPWSADNFPSRTPKSWRLEASNDNTNWVTIDTQTNYTTWTISTYNSFTCTNTIAYLYYRVYVLANVGGVTYTGLSGFSLDSPGTIAKLNYIRSSGVTGEFGTPYLD